MRPTNRLSQKLRLEALEGREVPATIPAFWFLSSTWVGGHSQVSTPPVVTPPPSGGGSGGTTNPPPTNPPATPTVTLNAASHTGVTAANTTILSKITLDGTTSPGVLVRLVEANRVVKADSTGAFHFTNVPVQVGANAFTVRATNLAGKTSKAITITRDSAPTVKTPLAGISVASNNLSSFHDLAGSFDDADIADTKVRFDTSAGPVNVELFDRAAPATVANFLDYVTSGAYANSIFHRSAKLAGGTPFVLQGGGFTFNATPTPSISSVPVTFRVPNEPDPVHRSNVRGTLAMAKLGGDPNSATDQFFFNLGNNSANLDNQNGGFTVFGKVVSAADQAVIDQLAAIPTKDESTAAVLPSAIRNAFGEVPLTGYTGTNFPTDTTKSNYAIINGVSIVSQPEALTYSVVGNTDPTVATATITNGRLVVTGVKIGTTTVTVKATDKAGASVTTTVPVTVNSGTVS